MRCNGPYDPPLLKNSPIRNRKDDLRIALLGAFLCALIPAVYGVYLIISVVVQENPTPGQAKSGTPAVAGMFFIVLAMPIIGLMSFIVLRLIFRIIRFVKPPSVKWEDESVG